MNVVETCFLSSGKRIAARVRLPDKKDCPAVVINHGYSGDKQEYDVMAATLCEHGYATVQFDSRGCGESESEKGRMMCSTEWVEDAVAAVSFASGLKGVDPRRIGFTGCSMGGAISLVMAAMDKRVQCAVLMAPLGDGPDQLSGNWRKNRGEEPYRRFLAEIRDDLAAVAKGSPSRQVSVPYALAMTEADERDFFAFRDAQPEMVRDVPLESVANSLLHFKPDLLCGNVEIPLMLLHGTADDIVPIRQSYAIRDKIKSPCELVVIEGAPHPLPTSSFAPEVFAHTVRWFDRYL